MKIHGEPEKEATVEVKTINKQASNLFAMVTRSSFHIKSSMNAYNMPDNVYIFTTYPTEPQGRIETSWVSRCAPWVDN